MNVEHIKSIVKLSGAEYGGIMPGVGVLITDKKTGTSMHVSLDYFFTYDDMGAIRWIKTEMLAARLAATRKEVKRAPNRPSKEISPETIADSMFAGSAA